MILRRPFSHGGPTGSLGNKMEDLRSGTRETLGRGEPGCASLGNAGGAPTTPSPDNLFTPLARPLPPGPGHVTTSPPLALSRGSSPPRRPFFLPPSESQDLSAAPFRNPSARPRLPTPPHPLPYNSSWLFHDRLAPPVMSKTAPSFQRGRRPRSTVVGFEGEARRGWGLFFVAEAAAAVDISRRGGGAVRPRWRRPVGWRNCEVNS